jgi:hypothetical protein
MTRTDILALSLICLVYAAAAFFGLGNAESPQSFYEFQRGGVLVLELSRPSDVSRIMYFTGADVGAYSVELPPTGQAGPSAELIRHAEVLKWRELKLDETVPKTNNTICSRNSMSV